MQSQQNFATINSFPIFLQFALRAIILAEPIFLQFALYAIIFAELFNRYSGNVILCILPGTFCHLDTLL